MTKKQRPKNTVMGNTPIYSKIGSNTNHQEQLMVDVTFKVININVNINEIFLILFFILNINYFNRTIFKYSQIGNR